MAWDQGLLFWLTWFGACTWIAIGIHIYDCVQVWERRRGQDLRATGQRIRRR